MVFYGLFALINPQRSLMRARDPLRADDETANSYKAKRPGLGIRSGGGGPPAGGAGDERVPH